tara:strand:- start:5334 stop:5969 length:636 start_codon:yes stop_codon:yes gene_type:complete
MVEWLQNNANIISAVSSVAMLVVWIIYLQAFLGGYRQQVRAKIVITRAVGKTLGAHCFISNMSYQAIYLEAVIVTLEYDDYRASVRVTDFNLADADRPSDPRMETHQGPLHSGNQTWIGTFDKLIDRVAENQGVRPGDFTASGRSITLEVMVVADYLSEDLVVGAKRRFLAEWTGDTWLVSPETIQTEQIRSRSDRRRLARLLAEEGEQAA